MADVSGITAVRPTANTVVRVVTYAETVGAGQPLYLNSSGKYALADADNSAATAEVSAIAMTPGVLDGFGVVATRGPVILVGATLTVGEAYIVSTTAGGIKPESDAKTTGDYISEIGRASSSSQLDLDFNATGIQAP